MKKAMIGILILIPVIILLVVAAVSTIVSTTAIIAVESVDITAKNGLSTVSIDLSDNTFNVLDYANVTVMPAHATDKTVQWSAEDVVFKDTDYLNRYNEYLEHKNDEDFSGEIVYPAVMMVDGNGNYVESNTTGKFKINAYCEFYIKGSAGTFSDRLLVSINGEDVSSVIISGDNSIAVGETVLLSALCNPIDSIVNNIVWNLKSGGDVVSLDSNGAVSAKAAGRAVITAGAKKFTSDAYIESAEFVINVTPSASKYGDVLYTHETSFTAAELGLGTILSHNELCSVKNGTISSIQSGATVTTADGTLTFYICGENEIIIENSALYSFDADDENSFVLAVGEVPLRLKARWKSQTKTDALNVVWSSLNGKIAAIDSDGTLSGSASGIVTVKASVKNNSAISASIDINVQQKIVMMMLSVTNKTLEIGIAGESVFASQKYAEGVDVTAPEAPALEANRLEIKFDYPTAPDTMDDDELAAFYSAFKFEIVAGKDGIAHTDMAYFDGNALVFVPEKITSQDKTPLRVKVSAKYPKYASHESYTTAYLDINVVNGVVCYTFDELKRAGEGFFDGTDTDGLQEIIYKYNNDNPDNKKGMIAAVLGADIQYPNKGRESVNNDRNLHFFGNVYGNNFTVSAALAEMRSGTPILRVMCSDVTISNIIARGNRLAAGQEEIKSLEDMLDDEGNFAFTAYVVDFQSSDYYLQRIENSKIEYSILENAKTIIGIYNADVTVDGCILRNAPGAGIYIPNEITKREDENKNISYYLAYSNFVINNCVMSTMLGTGFNFYYTNYITMPDEEGRIETEVTKKVDNKTVTIPASPNPVWKRFYNSGKRSTFKVTGFLDSYNWQKTENASYIDSGIPAINDQIKDPLRIIVSTSEAFAPYRMTGNDGSIYVHLGFMTAGVTLNGERSTLRDNPNDYYIEDSRYDYVDTASISFAGLSISGLADARIWLYRRDMTNITPSSTYSVNSKLISRLRG